MIFSPFVDLIIRLRAGLSSPPECPHGMSVAPQAQQAQWGAAMDLLTTTFVFC
jgi:hypothetical protein